jgi:hypothetical protein
VRGMSELYCVLSVCITLNGKANSTCVHYTIYPEVMYISTKHRSSRSTVYVHDRARLSYNSNH